MVLLFGKPLTVYRIYHHWPRIVFVARERQALFFKRRLNQMFHSRWRSPKVWLPKNISGTTKKQLKTLQGNNQLFNINKWKFYCSKVTFFVRQSSLYQNLCDRFKSIPVHCFFFFLPSVQLQERKKMTLTQSQIAPFSSLTNFLSHKSTSSSSLTERFPSPKILLC